MFWASVFGLLVSLAPVCTRAQTRVQEPMGRHIQAGVAFASGLGLNLGVVSARTLYIREIQFVSNLNPLFRETGEQTRIATLLGFSLRAYGFERLLGNAGYRGYDLDIGLRVGPGLSFSSSDTRVDKNKRFILLVEPMLRISRSTPAGLVYFEGGAAAPHIRLGMWIPW